MKNLTFSFLITILLSQLSFSQLDSVYYQGPSTGSVPGGAIQNTDFFSDEIPFYGGEQLNVIPPIERTPDNYGDMIHGWNESQLPEYIYVEDSNTIEQNKGNGSQPVILNSFDGIPMTNFIPPDPVIAAGPDHIIICANSLFWILDKTGHVVKMIPAGGWWSPAWPDENGDPQVIYDFYEERWIMVWMQVNDGSQTAGNLIAYSDDENPLGEWYMYRLDTKMHGTVPSNTWGDYPHIGFDEEAFYILTRCIDFSGAGHQYNKIRIINKTELYSSNGGPLSYRDIWDIRKPGEGAGGPVLDCIHPAVSYTPGSGAWFYWARGVYGGSPVSADFYAIYQITNPLTNNPGMRGKVLPVQTYTSPPLANQLGGGLGLETIGWITSRPVLRDGFLYAAHDIQNSMHPNYSSIKYMKIDLSTVSLVENVEYGLEGNFYLFPALAVDKDHNMAITFSRSADTEYVGSYYSSRYVNDPPGLSPSQPLAEGQGNYVVTYSGTINRWGDYFGIFVDPEDEYNFWMISEYAAATNVWGTHVGHIRLVPYSGPHAFSNPNSIYFSDVEVGTTSENMFVILSNYGDSDLLIYVIPSSFGDFNLETSLSFPYTLPTYDSLYLEFSFSPSQPGNTTLIYPVPTNYPSFAGFDLSGNGYEMYQAFSKVFYASSGSQNGGNILTINDTSGGGTILGPSLFNAIKSISIHPESGIMHGLVTGSGSSEIVRVNGLAGDAYILHTINIPNLTSIAFDVSGNLYTVTNTGEFHTIDLISGSTNFIVDAIGSYQSITFEPVTNELWATSRSFLPPNKDAVFKVDLSSGDTTIVGHTGLGDLTNAIVFDDNSNLFGTIGTDSEVNDFISIDATTGVGTIMGSIGFKHILGLAYAETDATSIDDNGKSTPPEEFALLQNYPNPFNPNTTIKYRLPEKSSVTLKVFDVIGKEIATLVNEEKSAGSFEVEFNAEILTSGVYFYRLQAGSFVETKKMVLIK
jgi:hypothetical protein